MSSDGTMKRLPTGATGMNEFENRLRAKRLARGFSQGDLARLVGVTRQAIYAIESNRYLPTTAVALQLARILECRVEELFSLGEEGETIEADLIGPWPSPDVSRVRAKVARVGDRVLARPVASLGDLLNYAVAADGLIVEDGVALSAEENTARVRVQLLRDRRAVDEEIMVAGCDPAIFLAGEHLRRRDASAMVVGLTMGSAAALEAVRRQEVHMAGLHVVDFASGESNLPYLRRHLNSYDAFTVVRFAAWEQGFMVPRGNPQRIGGITDLADPRIRIVNREEGSGARLLLDQLMAKHGVSPVEVRGYDHRVASHVEVGRLVAEGEADVGIGVRSAATLRNLDFIPLQEEHYDLVFPTAYLHTHPALSLLLDTIVSRPFRTEIEALGGYDTRETGNVLEWNTTPTTRNGTTK